MRAARAALMLLLPVGLSGCFAGGFPGGNAFHETVEVSRGLSKSGELVLENTNGSVRVASWDEATVRIEATKGAPTREMLRSIEVLVEGEGDRVSVRTRLPRGRLFGSGGQVEYRVTVPRGARVSVKNVNGGVEVAEVSGGVRAATVNGSVDLSRIAGAVEAEAVNGTVDVAMTAVDPASHNRLGTTNGTVRLTLPRDVSAEVEAGTVNGAAHCDFDLADGATVSRRKVAGRIGQGGARFVLSTVNGTASIDRGLAIGTPAGSPTGTAEAAPAR